MGFKPVPTKKFKKYLKNLGLVCVRKSGDHEIWDFQKDSPLLRPLTIIGCEKDIPALHIKTNLQTLGVDQNDFEKEIKKL